MHILSTKKAAWVDSHAAFLCACIGGSASIIVLGMAARATIRPILKKLALLLALAVFPLLRDAAAQRDMGTERVVGISPSRLPANVQPPNIPVTDPNPAFPLHVRLFTARSAGTNSAYYGSGIGNILGTPQKGFEFAFHCTASLVPNVQDDGFYQARWKQPDMRLEILTQRVGSKHTDTCALDVTLKAQPFTAENTPVLNPSQSMPSSLYWDNPYIPDTTPDAAYPLHLHVITALKRTDINGAHGYGTANLLDGTTYGVDYNYDCPHILSANSQLPDYYQARWAKQNERLELLVQPIGSDHVGRCSVTVTLKKTAYDINPGFTTVASPPQP